MFKQQQYVTDKNDTDQNQLYLNKNTFKITIDKVQRNKEKVNCIIDMICTITKIRKIQFESDKYSRQFYCIYVQKI